MRTTDDLRGLVGDMILTVTDPDLNRFICISNRQINQERFKAGDQRIADGITGLATRIIHYSIS
jgi:hypothetical protein